MDRIQLQAAKLWDLLFDDETAETYQKAFNLTATILKELAQLIWLTLISVFVFGAWFSNTSVKTGKSIRDWIDSQGGETVADSKPIGETSKELLDKGLVSVNQLLNQAREQLGLEPQALPEKPAAQPSAAPKPTSKPAAKQPAATPTQTAPAATKSPAAQPSAEAKAPSSSQPTKATPAATESETSREDIDSDWPPQTED